MKKRILLFVICNLFIPPSQDATCMHVDECEEKAARRDVTKWASYSCRRDNPDEYAEIIAREFRHGLRVGVNKGTTGMPVGLFSIAISQASAAQEKWNLIKSTHFIIHYKNAPLEFLEQLKEKAEHYYNKIADDLGFRRYDFWLWDDRARIYIYDNQEDYQVSSGQPVWSAGCAQGETKTIMTFPYAKGFSETILPHEMGHIIFREFVGFNNSAVPLWLDEGVASFQEKQKVTTADEFIKEALKKGGFLSLERLNNLNPFLMSDLKQVSLFYAESLSVIDFLIKEYGKDNFVNFCQNLRDKKDLKRAIASSYPFGSLLDLNSAWQKYLKKKYGMK